MLSTHTAQTVQTKVFSNKIVTKSHSCHSTGAHQKDTSP